MAKPNLPVSMSLILYLTHVWKLANSVNNCPSWMKNNIYGNKIHYSENDN